MKNFMKKWKWLAVLAAAVWMYVGFTQPVFAEEISNARTINVNEGVYDSLGDKGNEKYYCFTITQDGCLTIDFSNPLQGDSEIYWKVYLIGESYNELIESNVYGNTEHSRFVSMGLPAGVYYIKVTSGRWNHSTDTYTLQAGFQASDVWEKEPNNEYLSATDMELNTDYYGANSGDDDYYKIKLKEDGCLTIDFSNPLQGDSEAYWNIYLIDEAYHELDSETAHGNYEHRSYVSMGLPAGTYYIKVTGGRWNSSISTYTIKAGFKKSNV